MRKRNQQEPVKVEDIHGHSIGFYREVLDGQEILIPSHIRRIETGTTRGWQFVMVRQGVYAPSFFVPDSDRGPVDSLDLATVKLRIHLKSIDPRRNIPYKLKEKKKGANRTGVAGVRMVWRFNRKRNLYELHLEARAGQYTNSRCLRIYVGTEFTVTEPRLKEAFKKTRDFRQFQIERLLIADTYKLPIKRPGPRKMGVTIEQAQALLNDIKARREAYHWTFIQQRWPSLETLSYITQWRRSRFTWRTENVLGYNLPVPNFITRRGDVWDIELRLPDGSVFADELEIGYDPEASLWELVMDGLVQHLCAAPNLIPEDSVYGFTPRHTADITAKRSRA